MPDMGYEFSARPYRARCAKIVDGDTFDALVDLGFGAQILQRMRLDSIDTPELHSSDPVERDKAVRARARLAVLLSAPGEWPLSIVTQKAPEKYGRWLARVSVRVGTGELLVNDVLVNEGHARLYSGGAKP